MSTGVVRGLGCSRLAGAGCGICRAGSRLGTGQRCLRGAAVRGQHRSMQDALACCLLLGYPASTSALSWQSLVQQWSVSTTWGLARDAGALCMG